MTRPMIARSWRGAQAIALLLLWAGGALAQAPAEPPAGQLASPDKNARLRAVQDLKARGTPADATPLARLITDSDDEVQLEAIATELNIFLADKVTPRRRVGLVVEVRGDISAPAIFERGPSALGPYRVPADVATALTTALRDTDPRVSLQALYAFGALAPEVAPSARGPVLAAASPIIAGAMGAPDPSVRLAAVQVAGRVYAQHGPTRVADDGLGDALVASLNDREDNIRRNAMWALGRVRYTRAVQALTDLARFYRRGELAEASCDAIARIRSASGRDELIAQLASKTPSLRLCAIEGLARLGDATQLPAILAAVQAEKSESFNLAGHFANVMLAKAAPDAIVAALARPGVHDQAFDYLVDAIPGRSELFRAALSSPDPAIRGGVADACGLSGDPEAAALVRPLMQDADPGVARAATRAVARLGDPRP